MGQVIAALDDVRAGLVLAEQAAKRADAELEAAREQCDALGRTLVRFGEWIDACRPPRGVGYADVPDYILRAKQRRSLLEALAEIAEEEGVTWHVRGGAAATAGR